jgi:hypothetical protein
VLACADDVLYMIPSRRPHNRKLTESHGCQAAPRSASFRITSPLQVWARAALVRTLHGNATPCSGETADSGRRLQCHHFRLVHQDAYTLIHLVLH